nr:CD1871A family CXXC motif-containing protein [uncultured Acetatifactor sp.]
MLAGAVFFGIGAARGELAAIWQKAVMICMECIGIG